MNTVKDKQVEKKRIMFRAPAELHRRLRMRAAQDDRTIESIAEEAIEHYLGLWRDTRQGAAR